MLPIKNEGFTVCPGDLGENVTTRGIDPLALATGTVLRVGPTALIGVTGLRNPCSQLDDYAAGLLSAVLDHDQQGHLVRKAGIMGVVLLGGVVRVGDAIEMSSPPGQAVALDRV